MMPLADSHMAIPQRLKRRKRPLGLAGKGLVELLPSGKGLTPFPHQGGGQGPERTSPPSGCTFRVPPGLIHSVLPVRIAFSDLGSSSTRFCVGSRGAGVLY